MHCVIQNQLLDSIRKQYYIDGVFPDCDHGFMDFWRHTILRRHMLKGIIRSATLKCLDKKKIKCVYK